MRSSLRRWASDPLGGRRRRALRLRQVEAVERLASNLAALTELLDVRLIMLFEKH